LIVATIYFTVTDMSFFVHFLLESAIQMSSIYQVPQTVPGIVASDVMEAATSPCVIKVIGVGGGGGNAVLRMIETGINGVGFSAINTDAQALARFKGIATSLNIGKNVTRGLGAGGIPDNGRKAAEESRRDILNLVQGCDLVFITAGL
jgi:cell division GTPase FtsZ